MSRDFFLSRAFLSVVAVFCLVRPAIAASQRMSDEEVIEQYGDGMSEIVELGTTFYRLNDRQAVVAIAPGQIINSSATYQPHLFADLHLLLQKMYSFSPADLRAVRNSIERQEEYVYPDQFPLPGQSLALMPDFMEHDFLECFKTANPENCLMPMNPCQGVSIIFCNPSFSQRLPPGVDFEGAAVLGDSSYRANTAIADIGNFWTFDPSLMPMQHPDQEIRMPQKFADLFFEKLGTPQCANVYELKADDPSIRTAYEDLDKIFRDLCEDGFAVDFKTMLLEWQNVILRLEQHPVLELIQLLSYRPAYDLAMALIPFQEGNLIDWGRITSLKDIRFSSAVMEANNDQLIRFFSRASAQSEQNSNTVVVQTSLTLVGMIHLLDQGLPRELHIPGVFTGVFVSNYGSTEVIALDINLCFMLLGADWSRVQAYSCN